MNIFIRENSALISHTALRALLFVAGVACLFYDPYQLKWVSWIAVFMLIGTAIIFVRLLAIFKANITYLLIAVALFLLIVSQSFALPFLFFISGFSLRYLVKKPLVIVEEKGVLMPGLFQPALINWNELNNVVVKDGILTIDLKNDKVYQLDIDEAKTGETPEYINEYCRQHLAKAL
jgi:hypothetical protein